MFSKNKPLFVAAAMAVGLTAGPAAAKDQITLGWTDWSDAEFITRLTERVLEDRLDYEVELVEKPIDKQYEAVANGTIDGMLMSWQPATHAQYLEEVGGKTVNLGMLYGMEDSSHIHASLGLAVPEYVPESEVATIADLDKDAVREKLNGRIEGIGESAGLTDMARDAVGTYDLDYTVATQPADAMTDALDTAFANKAWVVVTGWRPHWMFGKYDLRFLKDPQHVLGRTERIHAVVREGFYQDNVHAGITLARMYIPLRDLENAMARAHRTSVSEAVDHYMANNEDRVNYWVTGDMPE